MSASAAPLEDPQNQSKNHVCPKCDRRFARHEHVQRHIRRHTKEKPFHCQRCIKKFTRRDLLKRHEAIAHSSSQNTKNGCQIAPDTAQTSINANEIDSSWAGIAAGLTPCTQDTTVNLHAMSDAATPLSIAPEIIDFDNGEAQRVEIMEANPATSASSDDQQVRPHQSVSTKDMAEKYNHISIQSSQYQGDDQGLVMDFTEFMDDMGFVEDWGMVGLVSPEMDLPGWQGDIQLPSLCHPEPVEAHVPRNFQNDTRNEDVEDFSHFASRLPSVQLDTRGENDDMYLQLRTATYCDKQTPRQPWFVTQADHQRFITNLEEFRAILPPSFQPPSKETTSRLLSGYFHGFDNHLPFIHRPTFSIKDAYPGLCLALCTVGAQYKFEAYRCPDLFYAAKAVVLEQIRRQDEWKSLHSTNSPSSGSSILSTDVEQAVIGHSRNGSFKHSRLQVLGSYKICTLQSVALLLAFSSWQTSLIHEAMSLQSITARLARELEVAVPSSEKELNWQKWICYEAAKRVKFVSYTIFSQQNLAFNLPFLLHSDDIDLPLPCKDDLWSATSSTEWKQAEWGGGDKQPCFQQLLVRLFERGSHALPAQITPLGNYIMIHALLEHIYHLRAAHIPRHHSQKSPLCSEDVAALEESLKNWKALWSLTPSSRRGLDPMNPDGPLSFTSTALLSLAYIRIHCDYGPRRHFRLRNPTMTAQSLYETPAPLRTHHLITALLHSVHALGILVKHGLNYVSQTQTLFWSMQHAICSGECAVLLAQWLSSISSDLKHGPCPLSKHEERLVVWLYRIVEETQFALNGDWTKDRVATKAVLRDPDTLGRLAVTVVRIWALAFRGQAKWQIVDFIGNSLDLYADLLTERNGQHI